MSESPAEFEDIDVFGVLSGAVSPCVYTYPQHVSLVTAMTARLGLEPLLGAHLFNLNELVCGHPCEETEAQHAPGAQDAELPQRQQQQQPPQSGESTAGSLKALLECVVNPPLCAHLVREGAAAMLHEPARIPTVLCRTPEETTRAADPTDPRCHHGGPHVHCLRCFHLAVEERGPLKPTQTDLTSIPPIAVELKGMWVEHYYRRQRHSKKLLEMLDGTRVAYLGDSDDEFDLEADEGIAECEAVAAEDARHCCFLVSVGTAACPVVVAYCAECNQFAPLTCFHWEGGDELSHSDCIVDEGDNKLVRAPSSSSSSGWGGWVSQEAPLTIMAKLLLACHLFVEGGQQWAQLVRLHPSSCPGSEGSEGAAALASGIAGVSAAAPPSVDVGVVAAGPRFVFLFKPSFFDLDAEEALVDQFESGSECTHGSAVLPAARVVGLPPDPKLLLLAEERTYLGPLLRTAAMAPPYTYAEAVEGFLMDFDLPELAAEKVAMVLRHDNHYRSAVRLVFVEDTMTWECAWVLHHYRETDEGGDGEGRADIRLQEEYEDPSDPTQSIRVKKDYTIQVPLPLSLWREYVEAARAAEQARGTDRGDGDLGRPADTDANRDVVDAIEGHGESTLDGLPFSLQSRTVNFFASMTSIALVLVEVLALQRGPAEH